MSGQKQNQNWASYLLVLISLGSFQSSVIKLELFTPSNEHFCKGTMSRRKLR